MCNMQILKVVKVRHSSKVSFQMSAGKKKTEKKMNIDLTLVSNVGKKPSHLTQKTPSFCWILDGEETHTLQPDSSQGYLNNQTNSILRFELSN